MSIDAEQTEAAVPPLRLVFWESTVRCNLECLHCRRLSEDQALAREDLTGDEASNVIRDLANTWPGAIFVFSGGEPLLRDDTLALARLARAEGLVPALATNGTLVTGELAGEIAEVGFGRVSVSLDGAQPRTHDRFRGVAGAFDGALAGLRLLRDAGVPVQINMSITRRNAAELDEMFCLAEAEGAAALHIFIVVPVGCGMKLDETDRLAPGAYERLLRQFYYRSAASPMETKATCAPQYARVTEQLQSHGDQSQGPDEGDGRPPAGGCLAGTGVCFVSHRGEVFPCGYLPVSCGNVRRQPLSVIWRESEVFRKLRNRKLLAGKCGRCEYAVACGGCRARAFAATGDLLAEEPDCIYLPHA